MAARAEWRFEANELVLEGRKELRAPGRVRKVEEQDLDPRRLESGGLGAKIAIDNG